MLTEAIAELERAASLGGGRSIYAASLAHALGTAGHRAQALQIIAELNDSAERRFVSSYDLAIASAGLGKKIETLDLLEAGVRERSPRVAFLAVDPRFDFLRADARFRALLRAIGHSA